MRLSFLLLLLLLLLLSGGSVFGQINLLPAQPATLAATPVAAAQPDTLAAIHRLFAHKRRIYKYSAVGTVGLIAVGGILVGTAPPPEFLLSDQAAAGGIIVVVGVFALLGEALTAYDYNRKSEQQTADNFQAHKLSNYVKRKLKPRYFR